MIPRAATRFSWWLSIFALLCGFLGAERCDGTATATLYGAPSRKISAALPTASLHRNPNGVNPITQTPYEATGNVLSVTCPNGCASVCAYDAATHHATRTETATNGNTAAAYSYDAEVRAPWYFEDAPTIAYGYDANWSHARQTQRGLLNGCYGYNSGSRFKLTLGRVEVRYYFTRDHLGSVREVTDSSNVLRARYDYDLYGQPTSNSVTVNPIASDFGFTGHYYHVSSGLYLAPYRAYNPAVGKWLSRDPIAEKGGINLFEYVRNDPINLVDPLGLSFLGAALTSPFTAIILGVAAGVAFAAGAPILGIGLLAATVLLAGYDWYSNFCGKDSTVGVGADAGTKAMNGNGDKDHLDNGLNSLRDFENNMDK